MQNIAIIDGQSQSFHMVDRDINDFADFWLWFGRCMRALDVISFSSAAFFTEDRLTLYASGIGRKPDTHPTLITLIADCTDEDRWLERLLERLTTERLLRKRDISRVPDGFNEMESSHASQTSARRGTDNDTPSDSTGEAGDQKQKPKSIAQIAAEADVEPFYIKIIAEDEGMKKWYPVGTIVQIYSKKKRDGADFLGKVLASNEELRWRPDTRLWAAVAAPEEYVAAKTLDQIFAFVEEYPFYVRRVANTKGIVELPVGTFAKITGRSKKSDLYDGYIVDSGKPLSLYPDRPLWTQAERPHSQPLSEIIGMEGVKEKVKEILATFKLTLTHSIENSPPKMVFAGAPGTGKTTIASVIAESLAELKVLRSPDVRIVSGASLKAGFVGQTAPLINKLFDEVESAGQLLLIDEVYTLFVGNGSTEKMTEFAGDAIGVLLTRIENLKNGSGLILAGYPDKLKEFFTANQGMVNRMQDVIFFENYSPEESLQILLSKLKEHKLKLAKPGDEATEAAIKSGLLKAVTKLASDPNYANGRTMRNFATHILRRLAVRLADQKIDENDLIIVEGDFAGFKDSGAILDSLAKFSGEMAEGDSIGFIKD